MNEPAEGPLRLRPAMPADLPQLEAWCHTLRAADSPPFIAATLAEFTESPARGFLLVVVDGERECGFAVVSLVWSNRARGETALIDDVLVEPGTDHDLLRLEIARFLRAHGIDRLGDAPF